MNGWLLLAIPLAPLAAAALALGLADRRPELCAPLVIGANAISLLVLLALRGEDASVQAVWFETGTMKLTVGLQLDALSRLMSLLIAAVALPVNCYAIGYMGNEPRRGYFFGVMSFFVGAMLLLVLSSSLALLFAAWEAVGLASFVLVGFHYREEEARRAAQRVFLLTRIGDAGFLLAWLLAWRVTGTTDIGEFLASINTGAFQEGKLTLLALLFLAGAAGKSAQLPLTAWLPRAMAGPTPVSALIHSATMVAAGVYLALRLYPLFAAAPAALETVLWMGAATALFSALVATAQNDLKRVLAWSTSSQLGEMMFALGLAGPLAAVYHLATHAVFKSSLFLAAGAVDHATGTRALDRLGALGRKLPVTAAVFAVAALALAGVPPLSGFWSEDRIGAFALQRGAGFMLLLLVLMLLAGVYIGRAAAATFGSWRTLREPAANKPPASMKLGMIALGLAAAVVGWLLTGSLERTLPFPAAPELSASWRIAGTLGAIAGLAFGIWRVRAAGPVPALGPAVLLLERALHAVTEAPARAAFLCASALDRVEAALDASARSLVALCMAAAGAARYPEAVLDGAARSLGGATLASASGTQYMETHGLSAPLDHFASLFDRAGAQMRRVQTGKLYGYTLALFLWVLGVGLLSVLWHFVSRIAS